nr:hypothetical protein [Tanacetum cinerariifolium]
MRDNTRSPKHQTPGAMYAASDMKTPTSSNMSSLNEVYKSQQLCHKKRDIALQSLKDVVLKFRLLRNPLANLPLFHDVSITDPGKKGRVSLNGVTIAEMRNLPKAEELKMLREYTPCRISVLCPIAEIACIGVRHEWSNSNSRGEE